jgi:RNA polymerase sigma-70 factor, ECF subfamily
MNEIDEITIKSAAKGNSDAFKRMYDHYALYVWAVIHKTAAGDESAAREILQDVFVRVHRSLRHYRSQSSFSTWLYRIAYNTSISHFSRTAGSRGRMVPLEKAEPTGDISDRLDARHTVRRLLSQITPSERFLIVSREIDDVSFEELSEITGKNPGALRTSVSRIKSKLREMMTNE